jgi:hypothetical protein
MNGNKRIEEFILKLSIRQNDPGLLNIINELKMSSCFNYPIINKSKHWNKYDHNLVGTTKK